MPQFQALTRALSRSFLAHPNRISAPKHLQFCYIKTMSTLKRKADLAAATAAANDPKKAKKDSSLTAFFGAPKPAVSSTNGASSPSSQGAAPSFDKKKWAASLKPETAKLLKLEIDTLDSTWLAHLKDEITSDSFLNLKKFLQKEIDGGATVYPPLEDVYSWY